jgi:uncharacterized protein (DUF433 family)
MNPAAGIDAWFPRRGPCGFCGSAGVDARHRAIEAIAGAVLAGDTQEAVADDYGVPVEAVQAVIEWVREHPGRREDSPLQ